MGCHIWVWHPGQGLDGVVQISLWELVGCIMDEASEHCPTHNEIYWYWGSGLEVHQLDQLDEDFTPGCRLDHPTVLQQEDFFTDTVQSDSLMVLGDTHWTSPVTRIKFDTQASFRRGTLRIYTHSLRDSNHGHLVLPHDSLSSSLSEECIQDPFCTFIRRRYFWSPFEPIVRRQIL